MTLSKHFFTIVVETVDGHNTYHDIGRDFGNFVVGLATTAWTAEDEGGPVAIDNITVTDGNGVVVKLTDDGDDDSWALSTRSTWLRSKLQHQPKEDA